MLEKTQTRRRGWRGNVEGKEWGVRFWGLREAPLTEGRLSFPVEILEKAGVLPGPGLPFLDGPWWDRGPCITPRLAHFNHWLPAQLASEFSAVWVGRGVGGKGSGSGSLCSVLVTPPGGGGMSSGLRLQQQERTFWVCIVVGPKRGRKEEQNVSRGVPSPLLCLSWVRFCHHSQGRDLLGWVGNQVWKSPSPRRV